MSCAVCSAGQLFVIRVKDNDYMFTKLPQVTSKSCSDDYYYDITTTSDNINPEDVRVLYCWENLTPTVITLGNNSLHDHFDGVNAIRDESHLCLKTRDDTTKSLTQMVVEFKSPDDAIFALAFIGEDGKRYYVHCMGTGQPLVISSTGPQYIFSHLIPTEMGAAA